MQKFKKSFTLVLAYLFFNNLESKLIKTSDVNMLSKADFKIFSKECIFNDTYKENLKCINFLGLKIFIRAYYNDDINAEEFKRVEKKSIMYLKFASDKGYKKASFNLGWIFSNKKSNFYNLENSSRYFKLAQSQSILENGSNSAKYYHENKLNYSSTRVKNVEKAILLMMKINIYYMHNDENNKFISKREHKKADIFYGKIIQRSNILEADIDQMERKVSKNNQLALNALKRKLKVFDLKIRKQAVSDLKKLINIYKN